MFADRSMDIEETPSRMNETTVCRPLPRRPAFGLFHVGTDFSANPKPITGAGFSVANYQLVAPEPKKTAVGLSITPLTPPNQETPVPRLEAQGFRSFADLTTDGALKALGNLSLSPSPSSGPVVAPITILRSKRSPRKTISLFKKLPEAAAPALPVTAKKTKAVAKKETKKRGAVKTAEGATPPQKRQKGTSPAGDISEEEIEKLGVQGETPKRCKGVSACKGQNSVKWRAQIWNGDSVMYLGMYRERRNAIIRYDLESIKLWGPKQASLNFGLENYPKQAKMYEEAQQEKAKMPEEENEKDKGDAELSPTTSKRQRKGKSVAKAAAPQPLAPAPAPSASAGPKKQGQEKYKGVSWAIRSNKWRAQVCYKGNVHHVGFFTDQAKAAAAYNIARLKIINPQAWTSSGKKLEFKDMELNSAFSSAETKAAIATSKQHDDEATNGAMVLMCMSS